MRNAIFFFVLLLSINAISKAQTQDSLIKDDKKKKMIHDALLTVLKIEKDYIEKGVTTKKINDDFNIWIDHYPAGFELTQEILDLNLRIKYISVYSLSKRQKKKGIYGIGFSGVRIDGNKILLYFNGKGVFLKGRILNMGIDGDGYLFEYEYLCEKQEWVLVKMTKQYKN